MSSEQNTISSIALRAVNAGLSLKTSKTLVKMVFAPDSRFVRENLDEILETIENIFQVLDRK